MNDKKEEPRKTLVRDPEVQAMDRLSRILASLESSARQRVVRWLKDRYCDGSDSPCAPEPDPNF